MYENVSVSKEQKYAQWSQWMALAQQGEKSAYAQLLQSVQREMLIFLNQKVFLKADVDDIAQTILLSMHQSMHTYSPGKPFKPWLYAIARHKLIDYYRKQQRLNKYDAAFMDKAKYEHDSEESNMHVPEFKQHLQCLSDKQKTILTLHKIDGFTFKEIASQLEMSLSAVKVAAHRAYSKLRKQVDAP